MALLDRARSSTPAVLSAGASWLPQRRRLAIIAGLLAAAMTWLIVMALVAVGWAMSPQGTTGFTDVVGVASAAWFLANGGRITIDGITLGVVPLGFWVIATWITARGWARIRQSSPRSVSTDARDYLAGYGAFIVLAGLLTMLGHARPDPSAFLVSWLVPSLALCIDLARHPDELDRNSLLVRVWQATPAWARDAVRPATHALAGMSILALLTVALAVVVHWSTVSQIAESVAPGAMGSLILILIQLAYVPTLALWALSFVAGPGFQVATEGSITLAGSHPGLLPMVPVLGAIPVDAIYPPVAWVAVLLPVGVGVLMGRTALRGSSGDTTWRHQFGTLCAAAGLAAGAVGAICLIATGPAGSGRLASVGPSPAPMVGALAVELALGGLLWWAYERYVRATRSRTEAE